jgi:uracil-DNA glycosylase family 4
MQSKLESIQREVIACRQCERLVEWRERVAREKVRRYRNDDYWGKPVPSFGDPRARLLILGLAPAAHGGNRVGRIFTGDRSGDWLFRALHKAGFANQPTSLHRDDGLQLHDCYISATARCAPPDNKPLPCELETCRGFLDREVDVLWPQLRVVVVLGKIAHDAWLAQLRRREVVVGRPAPAFGHLAEHAFSKGPTLLCSFHPSQQNTQTGKLTEPMFDAVWARAAELIARKKTGPTRPD